MRVTVNPERAENAKQIAPEAVCQKPWKAAGAPGLQCLSNALSILLFAFKNIPVYVEAQSAWFFPSPASLAWSITHERTLLPSQPETLTER